LVRGGRFCSFSSTAALVGSPGQGAYAAANSWLDGFTLWRRAQGHPTTAIAWGAWAQVGRATALAEAADIAIAPDEGAYAFEALLRHERGYTGCAPIVGTPWLSAFAQHSPFAEAFRAIGQNSTVTSKLRAELNGLPPDEWPTRLRRLVSDQLSLILRRNVDPDRPLFEYGMDSLGALELRTRIETATGIRINPSDLASIGAIRGLAAAVRKAGARGSRLTSTCQFCRTPGSPANLRCRFRAAHAGPIPGLPTFAPRPSSRRSTRWRPRQPRMTPISVCCSCRMSKGRASR
jgi:acyl carrier protein